MPSDVATDLAYDRTKLAHERTLMAWVRTATSLISFGFTIYKFFDEIAPTRPHTGFGSRPFALAMISIRKLTGRQFGDFALRLRVASEVRKKGERFLVGTGCQPHACNSDAGFVAIDRKAHSVFLAMRSDKDLTTWPKAASWPAPLRTELRAWEKAD